MALRISLSGPSAKKRPIFPAVQSRKRARIFLNACSHLYPEVAAICRSTPSRDATRISNPRNSTAARWTIATAINNRVLPGLEFNLARSKKCHLPAIATATLNVVIQIASYAYVRRWIDQLRLSSGQDAYPPPATFNSAQMRAIARWRCAAPSRTRNRRRYIPDAARWLANGRSPAKLIKAYKTKNLASSRQS